MSTRMAKDKIDKILNMYNKGETIVNISKKIGACEDTISKYIHKYGEKRNLTEKDKKQICMWYKNNQWEKIFDAYPFLNKSKVYHIASQSGIKKESYFWLEEDIKYLINNFGKLSYLQMSVDMENRHSPRAISTKAIKLGLTSSQFWTKKEEEILIKYYSSIPKEKILKMLPNRTEAAIVCHAVLLGIKGYHYLQEKYSEEQKQFILDNYNILSDEEMAKLLNKTTNGVKDQKRKMGIYKINKEYNGYENIAKVFRGQIYKWKEESMKNCNYQCILTGSKDYKIHHLYGFNKIVEEALFVSDEQGLLKGTNPQDYTKEEMDVLINIFLEIHNKYPLGVCVRTDLHDKFHEIYGIGNNTPEQWNAFEYKYVNNIL